MDARIILGPVVTEKAMNEASKGKYTFRVATSANKKDIKEVIEDKFKVNVLKIATITIKGRSVRTGVKRLEVLKAPFKKAIVMVKAGQKIALFDSGTKEG